jgi:hypothetical protein
MYHMLVIGCIRAASMMSDHISHLGDMRILTPLLQVSTSTNRFILIILRFRFLYISCDDGNVHRVYPMLPICVCASNTPRACHDDCDPPFLSAGPGPSGEHMDPVSTCCPSGRSFLPLEAPAHYSLPLLAIAPSLLPAHKS